MAERVTFPGAPGDQPQRRAAVRVDRSVIVQAPAGSGKTTLLVERFLALLATVNDPKRVLAITFTRSAVADMRARAMKALACAAGRLPATEKITADLLRAASAAMEASTKHGWNLLEQPEQLNIQTIDGLGLSIARQTPLTAGLGPGIGPSENAKSLYLTAALRTLQKLEVPGPGDYWDRSTTDSVALLLRHRDNLWQPCADLLARMLETRDQWGRLFLLGGKPLDDASLDNAMRPQLEAHLRRAIEDHLNSLRNQLAQREQLSEDLLSVARDFAPYYADAPRHYRTQQQLPAAAPDAVPHWIWLANICFTQTGGRRKQHDGRAKFPAGIPQPARQAAAELAEAVCDDAMLRDAFLAVRTLPPARFTEDEWAVAKAMFRMLRHALIELQMVFAQSGVVDFAEIGFAARRALGDEGGDGDHPSELALALADQYQHLLVDEFQDTSRTQLALISRLIKCWNQGEGRTVFFVGDPQQSIYLFRQADVRLFHEVIAQGIAGMAPERATLAINFRSHRALVDAHNQMLEPIFANSDVEFSGSQAHFTAGIKHPLHWHFSFKPAQSATPREKADAAEQDACHACDLAQAALDASETSSVAILVRAKTHAYRIMDELHRRRTGFRAIDMEPLSDRQEVLDVFSLTRAILDSADRVAWLALLRAPWCGLQLSALDQLAGDAKSQTIAASVAARMKVLSFEDQQRVRRVLDAVRAAQAQLRDMRLPFAAWTAWQAIGGDACVNAEQYENVCAYFAMLERMDHESSLMRCDTIEAEMQRLCAAPDPGPGLRLQIMTIHRAKGLEFDVVIVPQLHRRTGVNDLRAVDWIEETVGGEDAWFLAPVTKKGEDKSPLLRWIRAKQKEREDNEAKRLFYVAATRARRELHLLGAVAMTKKGLAQPAKGTLLYAAWPAAREIAEAQLQAMPAQPAYVEQMAAAGEVFPAGNTLCRLPQSWHGAPSPTPAKPVQPARITIADAPEQAVRAGLERRAAGTLLHSLLENAARRRGNGEDWPALQAWAGKSRPRIEQLLIAGGVSPGRAARHAANVHGLLKTALASPNGQWLLSSRRGELIEYPVTAWSGEAFFNFRLDRVFPAGDTLLSEGESRLWLVDYKSAALAGTELDDFLALQTSAYAEKMQRYAEALRAALNDARPIQCALYFPAHDLVHLLATLD